ncbi:MAG TPA: flagellar biosynthetic protein FliO [Steroidobacteraceae bacterium]|nr:flagellar biosynthetic protein FliO [Steroidobacteraceae bacterium]
MPRRLRFLILSLLSPLSVMAADAPLFAAPATTTVPAAAGGAARVVVSLILVLAAVFAAAWLARRMRGLQPGGSKDIEIVAQVTLGARERAVLLKVGQQSLLVGVAPGNVRLLHALEAVDAVAANPPPPLVGQRPSFKELLLRSLGK